MLKINHLALSRGQRLLFCKLNLNVSPGGIIHVKGPNGCGKSSLLACLAGFLPPTFGSISLNGMSIQKSYHQVGYYSHALGLKPTMTVLENLRAQLPDVGELTMNDYLQRWGLGGLAAQRVHMLSLGQTHKLALVRLLLQNSLKLWLLDEPFLSLDNASCERLVLALKGFLAQEGMVLFSSHQSHPAFEQLNPTVCALDAYQHYCQNEVGDIV